MNAVVALRLKLVLLGGEEKVDGFLGCVCVCVCFASERACAYRTTEGGIVTQTPPLGQRQRQCCGQAPPPPTMQTVSISVASYSGNTSAYFNPCCCRHETTRLVSQLLPCSSRACLGNRCLGLFSIKWRKQDARFRTPAPAPAPALAAPPAASLPP